MTNFVSIAGGALWAVISLLLLGAALEPVSVSDQVRLEMAQSATSDANA